MPWHLSTGRLPLSVDAIHGDRSQRDREAALQHFRSGAIQVQQPIISGWCDGAATIKTFLWTWNLLWV